MRCQLVLVILLAALSRQIRCLAFDLDQAGSPWHLVSMLADQLTASLQAFWKTVGLRLRGATLLA